MSPPNFYVMVKKMIKIQHKKIIAFVFLFLLIFQLSLTCFTVSAEGSEATVYSNAINDLRRSTSFDEGLYPGLRSSHEKYYSLEVITIAESEDDELFVYVYQPSGQAGDLRAASIDISTSERTDKSFTNYKLTYLNSHGVFFKYKVEGLKVSSAATRYYEISDILRPWSLSYGDEEPGGGNTISEVAYPVGKLFTLTTVDDESIMKVEDMEYIEITDKYVGYIRYEDDTVFPLYGQTQAQDAHFVAFSTNKTIDKLLEADVYYESRIYDWWSNRLEDPWGSIVECYKYLDYEQEAECNVSDGSIFTESKHIWSRIQRTSDFLNQEVPVFSFAGFNVMGNIEFTGEALDALSKTEWVLSFAETPYISETVNEPYRLQYSRVGNVKILRLKFKTDGQIYDLGVVDNKQTGSDDPAAVVEQQDWWQKIMMVLMLLVLLWALTFLVEPIRFVFKIIWKGIKICFKFFVWLLSRPWAIFRWLLGFLDKKQSPKRKKKGD